MHCKMAFYKFVIAHKLIDAEKLTVMPTSSYFLLTRASLNLNSVGSMERTRGLTSRSRQNTLLPLILVM